MKPKELVELIKKEDPKMLAKMPDQKVVRIIRAAFIQVGKQLDAMNEGVVKVPGFGNFRVRQGEREKDGQKVTVKRMAFRRAKQKERAGGKRRAGKSRKVSQE